VNSTVEKTHYRKAFNSPYLSSADIVGPTVLTIERVVLQGDATKKTKDWFNTAYFVEKEIRKGEPLKPMILNAYNSKIVRDMTGSHFIDDWCNVPVTIYVDRNVRFGRDTVEGLRLSPQPPAPRDAEPQKNTITDERLKKAITSINGGEFSLDQLHAKFILTSDQVAMLNEGLK
jgi:hypothetical protein